MTDGAVADRVGRVVPARDVLRLGALAGGCAVRDGVRKLVAGEVGRNRLDGDVGRNRLDGDAGRNLLDGEVGRKVREGEVARGGRALREGDGVRKVREGVRKLREGEVARERALKSDDRPARDGARLGVRALRRAARALRLRSFGALWAAASWPTRASPTSSRMSLARSMAAS